MEEIEKYRVYNYYCIQCRALENLISWWSPELKAYENLWDSNTWSTAVEFRTKNVPKLEAHYLCKLRNVLTFEEFWSNQYEQLRRQIKTKYEVSLEFLY